MIISSSLLHSMKNIIHDIHCICTSSITSISHICGVLTRIIISCDNSFLQVKYFTGSTILSSLSSTIFFSHFPIT
jgi:hypothetical protein